MTSLDEAVRAIVREEIAVRPTAAPEPEWFTVAEGADYLRISKRTLEHLVGDGEVRSFTSGRRRIIRRSWLDNYAERNT